MKIVFCSNYMNHHQLYLSQALLSAGIDYSFIASEKIEDERKEGGWKDLNTQYDWIVRIYENAEQLELAKRLIKAADLVVVGSFPMKLIRKRIFQNKPVFLYSERWFKSSDGDINRFKTFHNRISNLIHRKYMNYFNVYMLCASAYTAYDCSLYNNFKGKCYKWGYFPHVKKYDIDALMKKKEKHLPLQLLWVARMIDWKHPEYPVKLAKKLKDEGFDFVLNMIGVGDEYAQIKQKIIDFDLSDHVKLLGSMSTEKVREYMESSDIFLFTSDYNEGWGAVLNEAMNSACAIVACDAIGSVPFLIENGVNGLTYGYEDEEGFIDRVICLMKTPALREKLGREAYRTILTEWNPDNAAKKLLLLYDKLILKKDVQIYEGICSKADIIIR